MDSPSPFTVGALVVGYWLIWSNEHNQWWRPDGQGYTPDITKAGLYSPQEAAQAERNCGPSRQGHAKKDVAVSLSTVVSHAPPGATFGEPPSRGKEG